MRSFWKLLRTARGATAVEYGLIAALIVLACVGAISLTAGSTTRMWGGVQANVAGAM